MAVKLYLGYIDPDTKTVAQYEPVNIVNVRAADVVSFSIKKEFREGFELYCQETINASAGIEIFDEAPLDWGTAITNLFGLTGATDFSSLKNKVINIFTSKDINSKINMDIHVINVRSNNTITEYFIGDWIRGIGFHQETNFATQEAFAITRASSAGGSSYNSLKDLADDSLTREAVAFGGGRYLNWPCYPEYATFMFFYNTKGATTYKSFGDTVNLVPIHRLNLNTYTNWYTMLTGKRTSNVYTLKLANEVRGIKEIELGTTMHYSSVGERVQFDFGGSKTYEDDGTYNSVAYNYYNLGTDITLLFDSSVSTRQVVELSNGMQIIRENQFDYRIQLNDSTGVSFKFLAKDPDGWRRPLHTVGDLRNWQNNGVYLIINPTWVEKNPYEWINDIPEIVNHYDIYSWCPILCCTTNTYMVGRSWNTDGAYWFKDLVLCTPCLITNWIDKNANFSMAFYGDNPYPDFNYNWWYTLLKNLEKQNINVDIGPGTVGGGGNNEGGGEGDYNDSSDTIESPGDRDGIANRGGSSLVKLYDISLNSLTALGTWLSSEEIFQRHAEYADGIISIKQLLVPGEPALGASEEINIGGMTVADAVGNRLEKQYQQFTIGQFFLKEYYGNFLDYAPYTKIKIYLPFVGELDLDPSIVLNSDCTLYATVDYFSGDVTYNITVNNNTTGLNSNVYTASGNASVDIPITYQDYGVKVSQYLTAAALIAGGAAVGFGVGGPVTAAAAASAVGAGVAGVAKGATAAIEPAPFGHVGAVGKNAGFMSPDTAYISITRPKMSLPSNFGRTKGFLSNMGAKIGQVSGYTVVGDVHLSGLSTASKSEISEIEMLLKKGVIV